MRMHLPAANTAGLIQDCNPYLEAYRNARPNQVAGGGQVFGTADRDLIVWQTRPAAPSEYERTLADTLEQIFAQRTYDLPEIVAALNREGVRTPAGETWTERNFQDTLRELGKLAFG
ncbi:MAG TPA: recombinase-like helix-turn-helix domain-containing protein [Burkholderiales bacterium]|nr:recombinase-like helix-turn-helix domain-containing protein [Burkholderiales bacterium]